MSQPNVPPVVPNAKGGITIQIVLQEGQGGVLAPPGLNPFTGAGICQWAAKKFLEMAEGGQQPTIVPAPADALSKLNDVMGGGIS